MADSHPAWGFVLSNEDPTLAGAVIRDIDGGMTRFGIDSKSQPGALARGFYSMPHDEALAFAEDLFRGSYWTPILGDDLASQLIASKTADLAFNESPHEATLLLQRAAIANGASLTADGCCGPQTVAAVNGQDPEALYTALLAQGTAFYELLGQEHPDLYHPRLIAAWLQRLNKRPPT